jgi:TonB-dependent SusC/RagA subfamily outer membrane receptor
MTLTWLAGLMATAALLGVAARAAEEVLRSYGRATRWVWVVALGASALLPALAAATGGAALWNWLPRPQPADLSALLAAATVVETTVATAAPADAGFPWDRVLLAGWSLGSLAALAVYGATWRRLRRSRRRWSPAQLAGTSVYVTARGGPAVVGVLRPSIVVPEWLLAEGEDAQRIVLLHEQEHMRAFDPALLAAAPLAVAAMPWNLALWWQLRRLRLAIELDCDRRVLARGVEPGRYGALLLDIAGRGGPALAGAAAIVEPRTFLERRILAMSSSIPKLRFARALALSCMAAVFALIACETAGPTEVNTPVPRPEPEVAVVEAAKLEGSVTSVGREPLIIVDGVIREREAGLPRLKDLLEPDDIERIEVVKGAAAVQLYGDRARGGVIQIFTKGSDRVRRDGGEAVFELREVPASEANAVLRAKTAAPLRAEYVDRLDSLRSKYVFDSTIEQRGGKYVIGSTVELRKADASTVVSGKQATAVLEEVGKRNAVTVRPKLVEEKAATASAGVLTKRGGAIEARAVTGVASTKPVVRESGSSAAVATGTVTIAELSDRVGVITAVPTKGQVATVVEGKATSTARVTEGVIVRGKDAVQGTYTYRASERPRSLYERAAQGPRPLFFIDGVRADDATLDRLDPADIERIEVVKGAAAVALYGASAKGGIIRITTKR